MTHSVHQKNANEKYLGLAAQAWCDSRVSDREMDSELAVVFSEMLFDEFNNGFKFGCEYMKKIAKDIYTG